MFLTLIYVQASEMVLPQCLQMKKDVEDILQCLERQKQCHGNNEHDKVIMAKVTGEFKPCR